MGKLHRNSNGLTEHQQEFLERFVIGEWMPVENENAHRMTLNVLRRLKFLRRRYTPTAHLDRDLQNGAVFEYKRVK